MSLHNIEYGFTMNGWGSIELELDPVLPKDEKEAIALAEIKEIDPDIYDIEILEIREFK